MKQVQSLDDLISRKAVEFADQMKQAAAMADKEEEIRIATERQLAFIEKEAGVKLEGRHEFTVASGRVDSVYQRVIIEYKNPSGPDRIGPGPTSPGTKKVVEQIKKRFYDLRKEHGQPINSLFGVGLDGNYFVFIRFRDDKWQVQDPVEVNKVSAERFLWALFNLGQKGKPFLPEYLAGDFGSEAKLAQEGIHTLYEAIASTDHPKAQTFFNQWKILFGEVCGYDVDNPSDKIKKLADFYGVPLRGFKPAELLFAVHTYYALFMKLLASEIVAFFHKLPTPLQKMMQATTSAKLKREMEELEKCAFGEGDLCRKMLANVIGFDLNPLAVMAARTNYLIAIRDLIGHVDKIEIPIYLCDSILTPSTYGGLFAGAPGAVKELKTAAAKFLIPTEIATKRDDVAKYAEQLELCVKNGYSPKEFIERCQEEGLPVSAENLHTDLYKELVRLDKANKNGVWARIIKNAFAPLFTGLVDYVIGNPPWVNWESLPADYRESTIGLWDKYRLRERATPGARLGNVKKELSALFVYACIDHYLAPSGLLAFLITQSVFKTGANEGFRRFSCGDKKPFRVTRVSDLSLCLPFENAINRTAILLAKKGEKTQYPVPYRMWIPKQPRSGVQEMDLRAVMKCFTIEDWQAGPVEPSVRESTWLTAPAKAYPIMPHIIGDRDAAVMDRAYAGSCTWLNGVYWVEPVKTSRGTLYRNMGESGRTKVEVVTAPLENDHLYPLLRGRDVLAWTAKPSALILVPHIPGNFGEPVSVTELKRKTPNTHAFLRHFEDVLRKRSGYKQLHGERAEFYVLGNVGNYTLAEYKVVFKDLTEVFQCAVVGPSSLGAPGGKPAVPDHTLLFLTCEAEDESLFLAGMLNSVPGRVALYSASVGVQTQRYFPTDVSRLRLPRFDRKKTTHAAVASISKECHKAAAMEDIAKLADCEARLAAAVCEVWGISKQEFRHLADYYDAIGTFRGHAADSDAADGEE